jgi:hypothetical protein
VTLVTENPLLMVLVISVVVLLNGAIKLLGIVLKTRAVIQIDRCVSPAMKKDA